MTHYESKTIGGHTADKRSRTTICRATVARLAWGCRSRFLARGDQRIRQDGIARSSEAAEDVLRNVLTEPRGETASAWSLPAAAGVRAIGHANKPGKSSV